MNPYAFRTVTIRNRRTGETFPHTNYTTSLESSVGYARLTFSEAVYAIESAGVASELLSGASRNMPAKTELNNPPPSAPPSSQQIELL